jgi:hypothetical protein
MRWGPPGSDYPWLRIRADCRRHLAGTPRSAMAALTEVARRTARGVAVR